MIDFKKRTDLAIEARESFPEDKVEIQGVSLEKRKTDIKEMIISTVNIFTDEGAKAMGKPKGNYVTIEFRKPILEIAEYVKDEILKLLQYNEKHISTYLICGLGNRFATPDALGPFVLEKVSMNRHLDRSSSMKLCGITPGVMSQTGLESSEIIEGLVKKIKPSGVIVIDALASRSMNRLCRTIQITDTGISPGAGIGNNRKKINFNTIGIPVVAIGVPTVVDAGTIVYEALEEAFQSEGYSDSDIQSFYRGVANSKFDTMFVTPKDIDESIRQVGTIIALALKKMITDDSVS